MKENDGFTLMEVLIALVIIAISLTAILKATSADIENLNQLKERIQGHYVANYALNLLTLSKDLNTPQTHYETNMFSHQWYWQFHREKTDCHLVNQLNVELFYNKSDHSSLMLNTTYIPIHETR